MISERKLEANRRNAQKSTGPRTEEGKAISRMNGLKHGLTSEFVPILPGEDQDAFNQLHQEIVNDLKPRGAMQGEIVDDLVLVRWKLRRLSRVEYLKMHNVQESVRATHRRRTRIRKGLPELALEDHPIEILARYDFSDSEYARLELYRQRLQRQMHTLLRELRQLRKEMEPREPDDDLPPRHSERVREESGDSGSVPPSRDPSPSTAQDHGARGKPEPIDWARGDDANRNPEPTDSHNPSSDQWKENDSPQQNAMISPTETEIPCALSSPDRSALIKGPTSKPFSSSPSKTVST